MNETIDRGTITMLGTGHAMARRCYNTCFVLEDGGQRFLVDGGGGNGLLTQLQAAKIDPTDLRDIFVTHKHLDHITGIFWMLRIILSHPGYEGQARIYGHDEVIAILDDMAHRFFDERRLRRLGTQLLLIPVEDGETRGIIGHPVTFFDIHSTKAKQFGFSMTLTGGGKLACCGDEPCPDSAKDIVRGSDWLLHEAFCLESQDKIFHPHEIHHSTVKQACELAGELGVKNVLLYHTDDGDLADRRRLYTAEGSAVYGGNIFVPDDLETIAL